MDNIMISQYKDVMKYNLQLEYPNLGDNEIDSFLDWSINKRLHDTKNVIIDNNYKETTEVKTLMELTQWIQEQQPVVTTYGCMFERHTDKPNPLFIFWENYIQNRLKHKAERNKHPKGTELYKKFDLKQSLDKIDCNA